MIINIKINQSINTNNYNPDDQYMIYDINDDYQYQKSINQYQQ